MDQAKSSLPRGSRGDSLARQQARLVALQRQQVRHDHGAVQSSDSSPSLLHVRSSRRVRNATGRVATDQNRGDHSEINDDDDVGDDANDNDGDDDDECSSFHCSSDDTASEEASPHPGRASSQGTRRGSAKRKSRRHQVARPAGVSKPLSMIKHAAEAMMHHAICSGLGAHWITDVPSVFVITDRQKFARACGRDQWASLDKVMKNMCVRGLAPFDRHTNQVKLVAYVGPLRTRNPKDRFVFDRFRWTLLPRVSYNRSERGHAGDNHIVLHRPKVSYSTNIIGSFPVPFARFSELEQAIRDAKLRRIQAGEPYWRTAEGLAVVMATGKVVSTEEVTLQGRSLEMTAADLAMAAAKKVRGCNQLAVHQPSTSRVTRRTALQKRMQMQEERGKSKRTKKLHGRRHPIRGTDTHHMSDAKSHISSSDAEDLLQQYQSDTTCLTSDDGDDDDGDSDGNGDDGDAEMGHSGLGALQATPGIQGHRQFSSILKDSSLWTEEDYAVASAMLGDADTLASIASTLHSACPADTSAGDGTQSDAENAWTVQHAAILDWNSINDAFPPADRSATSSRASMTSASAYRDTPTSCVSSMTFDTEEHSLELPPPPPRRASITMSERAQHSGRSRNSSVLPGCETPVMEDTASNELRETEHDMTMLQLRKEIDCSQHPYPVFLPGPVCFDSSLALSWPGKELFQPHEQSQLPSLENPGQATLHEDRRWRFQSLPP